ncbi:MAG: helix-turn-helix domain-containing protein, partial [Bdellovibrionota bacterium]
KTLAEDALEALRQHSWPGNVRELRRVVEQLALHSPLPIVRRDDAIRVLPLSAKISGMMELDLSRGLASLVEAFEADLIKQALTKKTDVDEAAALLGISRSSLYKKIKDYQIDLTSRS